MLTPRAPAALLLSLAAPALAGPTFNVSFDAATRPDPATGRLIVYLIREGNAALATQDPSDAPFWGNPQPMYGIDVANLAPGAAARVGQAATFYPIPTSELPPGSYRAQAVLDLHRDNSSWRREPGNLWSDTITFTIDAANPSPEVALTLNHTVAPRELPRTEGVEFFETRSALLSDFCGRDIVLRAGVVLPTGHDPARAYPAIYHIPGFGGDHTGAARRNPDGDGPEAALAAAAFSITLDPESANGHTLFADSDNNGPRGRALVEELIPALEAKYNLIAKAEARLLSGHSSGGWSTLWLAISYPDTFGACWSSSPDPVDFRRFQLVDIYSQDSMYEVNLFEELVEQMLSRFAQRDATTLVSDVPDGPVDIGSLRSDGRVKMTVRQENLGEEVLGPDNTSGQQWDSWLAAWGPRNAAGNPAALYNPVTGELDHNIAESLRRYDITERLRASQGTVGLIFHQRIRLIVGDQDSFYLNEAVSLLEPEVEKLNFFHYPEGRHGYIKIIPGADHGSVMTSPEARAFPTEMLDHLGRAGLTK